MLIPKENTKKIYEYLLKEGVIVVKKDVRAPKHSALTSIPNLQVMLTLRSLKSKGCVTETFCWHHHYYVLTDEGILFLRNALHVPESVVPATLVKSASSSGSGERRGGDHRRGGAEGGAPRRAWRGGAEASKVAAA